MVHFPGIRFEDSSEEVGIAFRYVVGQDYSFVLGDNPDMSRDSRHWGLVPERTLLGEVLGVIWPLRIGDRLS